MTCYNFSDNSYIHINQCYDRVFKPFHVMPEIHKHVGFEIMYIVRGNVSVEFFAGESAAGASTGETAAGETADGDGAEAEEVYNLFPGDFIFLESDRFHRLKVSETGARIVNTQASPSASPRYDGQRTFGRTVGFDARVSEFFRYQPGTFRLYDSADLFNTLFLLAQKYFADSQNNAVLGSLLQVLLNDVADLYVKNLKSYRGHSYIKKAVFLIENTLGNVSPDGLAAEVGLSRSYLHKLFKDCFSKSITEYICDYKIMRACHRFRSFPDMRVSDAAAELGFGSLLRFERAFKRVMGITPGEYRRRAKQSSNTWIMIQMPEYIRL